MLLSPELLQALNGIQRQLPRPLPGATADIFSEIEKIIKRVVQGIIDAATGTLSGLISGISSAIQTKIQDVYNFLSGISTSIYRWLFDENTGLVTQLANKIETTVNGVITGIQSTLNTIGDAISGAIEKVVTAINSIISAVENIGTTIGNIISGVINGVASWIANAVSTAVSSVSNWISGAVEDVGNWIAGAVDAVSDWVVGAVNDVADWISGAYNTVVSAINAAKDWVSGVYNTVSAFIRDKWDYFIDIVKGAISDIRHWLGGVFTQLTHFFENNVLPLRESVLKLVGALRDFGTGIFNKVLKGDYAGAIADITKVFDRLDVVAPTSVLYGIVSMIAYFWETVRLQFLPMEIAAAKHAEIALALSPISESEAVTAVYKGLWDEKAYLANAALGAIAPSRAKTALEANRPYPSPGQTQQLFLRGEIREQEHDDILESYGYTKEHIKEIKALYQIIPGVQDIITMAVREAFTPEIAQRFGQYEDLPQAFIDWAAKQGLTKDWASRYWAAHWDLPSPQMGFDMYHRRIIDEDDLKLLLKALDVMPFWREQLIKLAYTPLNRVDIRRMYKSKVLNEKQVYEGYLDLGYKPYDARNLSEFTIRYYTPEDTDQRDEFFSQAKTTYTNAYKNQVISKDEFKALLRGLIIHPDDVNLLVTLADFDINRDLKIFDLKTQRSNLRKMALSAYSAGLINPADLSNLLETLGYNRDEVILETQMVDYDHSMSDRQLLIDQLHDMYVGFIIDDQELYTTCQMFNFGGLEIEKFSATWAIERSYRTKRPGIADLRKFLDEGIISLENFLDELRGLGYNEKYIDMYAQYLSLP